MENPGVAKDIFWGVSEDEVLILALDHSKKARIRNLTNNIE